MSPPNKQQRLTPPRWAYQPDRLLVDAGDGVVVSGDGDGLDLQEPRRVEDARDEHRQGWSVVSVCGIWPLMNRSRSAPSTCNALTYPPSATGTESGFTALNFTADSASAFDVPSTGRGHRRSSEPDQWLGIRSLLRLGQDLPAGRRSQRCAPRTGFRRSRTRIRARAGRRLATRRCRYLSCFLPARTSLGAPQRSADRSSRCPPPCLTRPSRWRTVTSSP